MSARPTPADRRRDLVAGTLLAVGVGLYGYGFLGLRRMGTQPIVAVAGETAVQRTHGFEMFTRAGLAFILVGAIALVWAAWRHRAGRAGSA